MPELSPQVPLYVLLKKILKFQGISGGLLMLQKKVEIQQHNKSRTMNSRFRNKPKRRLFQKTPGK
jgi:hypothetical protein